MTDVEPYWSLTRTSSEPDPDTANETGEDTSEGDAGMDDESSEELQTQQQVTWHL